MVLPHTPRGRAGLVSRGFLEEGKKFKCEAGDEGQEKKSVVELEMRKGHRSTCALQNKNLWDKNRGKYVPCRMSAPYLVICCHRVSSKRVQHSQTPGFQPGTLLSCCSPLDITQPEHFPCDFHDTQPKDADFLCSITGVPAPQGNKTH